MELLGLAAWQSLLLILAISGVVSFGVVHVLKMLYFSYIKSTPENDSEPWWWSPGLQFLAILVGGAIGSLFALASINVIVAVGVGLAGGTLNTFIVKTVKARLKAIKLNSSGTEPEVVEGEASGKKE